MLTSLLFQDSETPKDQTGELDVNTQSIIEKLDSWLDGLIRNLPNILVGILIFIAVFYLARYLGKLVKNF